MNRKEHPKDNQIYHIYNRGNRKDRIFYSDREYRFFIQRIYEYAGRYHVDVLVYCLMPNHYHCILRQQNGGDISSMMMTLATSITKRSNLIHGKVGHLFQGPYRIRRVDNADDLLRLAVYVHRNPVVARLATAPEKWHFSNYLECASPQKVSFQDSHLEGRKPLSIPDNQFLPIVGKTAEEYRAYAESAEIAIDEGFPHK
jgi:putative transposase